jgi:hypothetical protein
MTNNKKGIFAGLASRFERNRLGELLVRRGVLSTTDLHRVLREQKGSGQTLGQILQSKGLASKSRLVLHYLLDFHHLTLVRPRLHL